MMEFPPHKASLTLEHNKHLDYYSTVKREIDEGNLDPEDFLDEEQMRKAIETNDVWTLQVYPATPIGFYKYAAHDLDLLLARALEHSKEPGY